jgi:uncharacterized protein (DUF58 family)
VAFGLLFAVVVARAWTRLAGHPVAIVRRLPQAERYEGDDVQVRLQVELERAYAPATVVVRERISKLGERETAVPGRGGKGYVLEALPRGRYAFEETTVVIEDPFGLDRIERKVPAPGALLVYPRLVELEKLFTESGHFGRDGRRLLLRRPAGFDLHSVRDYEQGESLRKVHWRSTAKRGQLMVKELEDSPRDEVAVVLDVDPATVVGDSFELQVRAAGSILMAHARKGRRAMLVVNSLRREQQRVHSSAGDKRVALDLLAAVEPQPGPPLVALLAEEAGAVARAEELTVVTGSLPGRLVEQLVNQALGHKSVSVVLVDSASFASGELPPSVFPGLLRLQAAGIAVAVVRHGDDLAARLGAAVAKEVAHA